VVTDVISASGLRRGDLVVSGFDVAIAVVLLLVLAPFLALIGIWVALESRGPVLVQRAVAGRGGILIYVREYRIWRTPTDASERSNGTAIGRVLCATGLRRLPRLLDIRAGRLTLAEALQN